MQRSFKISVDLSVDVQLTYISCSNRQSKNARLLLLLWIQHYYLNVDSVLCNTNIGREGELIAARNRVTFDHFVMAQIKRWRLNGGRHHHPIFFKVDRLRLD